MASFFLQLRANGAENKTYMFRKPQILALALILLAAGQGLWPMGQGPDIFGPVDLLVQEKKYEDAIDLLRRLLVSSPSKTKAIKDRIGDILLKKADENISNQRYNEAFEDATRFWRENPERADEAQKRIKKVNEVREKYNKKSYELYEYITNEKNRSSAGYNEAVVRLLQELDELDRNNPDSKNTINYLKETSLALVNQDTMKRIMSEARALIDGAQYVAAARKYLEGFDLFRPEFENAGYDAITMAAAAREVAVAESAPGAYAAMQYQLENSIAALRASLESGSIEAIEAAKGAARAALDGLEELRSGLFAAASNLDAMYEVIPKADRSPIEYQYLAFIDVLIRGRSDELGADRKPVAERGLPEGIGGTMIAQWDALQGRIDAAAQAGLDAAYSAGETAYGAGKLAEAIASYDRAASLAANAAEVLEWHEDLPQSDFIPDLKGIKENIAAAAASAARLDHEAQAAAASSRLAAILDSLRKVAARSKDYYSSFGTGAAAGATAGATASGGAASGAAAVSNEAAAIAARAALDAFRREIRAIEEALAAEAKLEPALAALAAGAIGAGADRRVDAVRAAYASKLEAAAAEALAAEYDTALYIARIEGDFMEREIAAREKAVAAAEALIDGLPSTRPDRAPYGYKDPSPTAASVQLSSELPRLQALAAWTAARLAWADAESEALRGSSDFAAARSRVKAVADRTAALLAKRAASFARAEERKKFASDTLAKAKRDLDSSLAKLASARNLIRLDKGTGARSAAIRKDFADARSLLGDATAGALAWSGADFDARVWEDYQRQFAKAETDIGQARSDFVVDETFRLLGEGQKYYEQALFDRAAEALNGAQELWFEENKAEQEQVKYWQNLVRQASDTNNKREVRQGDTLYYEISSYLSEARRLYLRGVDLKISRDETGAAAAFDSARQNISFITRAFPLNADAGLLTLQILKATDPEAYRQSLPRRVTEALNLLETDAASGYSSIADLYKMEPNYPGLKAALERAEIKVGRRRAPPTREALAQAKALVAQAEKLRNTGRKDDQAEAEKRLNAALAIDQTNARALALLREINILKGKETGIILGIADKAILDQATREYAARTYNQARDTLNRLLNDPNKRSRDVLKLDNDLKALGYP